ncbi:hypothetical protein XIS1_610048 [Xenorhabdus innexi]|uniref:Uncharacterized protein n=1 Tax=Xenorhabdus innexi TaxID=290109 RepID=A0A1N6N043_9GAMM|nr:hypothetical protein XIS1_610048 [Xenorhabdus innexi]
MCVNIGVILLGSILGFDLLNNLLLCLRHLLLVVTRLSFYEVGLPQVGVFLLGARSQDV